MKVSGAVAMADDPEHAFGEGWHITDHGELEPREKKSPSFLTERVIPHDEARDALRRLTNSHFHQEPHARISIPARPDYDDDLVLSAYIEQQAAKT